MAHNKSNKPASSTALALVKICSSISLPSSVKRTQSNKIQNRVEYTYIPESAQIDETSLTLMNPYTVVKRKRSLARKTNILIQHRSYPVNEYVQSITLDNCLVPTTKNEQYIDLQIDQQMIDQWIREGYSHLYIGTVCLILTLHGRKSLSVTARVYFLNTIYKQYEHAVIGTYLSTFYASSISLTYYPNFNIPLSGQNLHNCFKSTKSSWEIGTSISSHQSDEDDVEDLTQVFMVSRTYPQLSTYTFDSPDEASTGPIPIVEEPPENYTPEQPHISRPTNCPWFNLEDTSPNQ
ncbi:hypothetical protein Ddye_013308 [Dipteronia dyeriana]|uniref:Polyprotein n=1 Tax=Dipteronia dyeriana TaxID=168575 RepID=A0AAD9X667_9ROSI|nr:hypothetical protein Ddye_013308 [Dipteronia dyeriana]